MSLRAKIDPFPLISPSVPISGTSSEKKDLGNKLLIAVQDIGEELLTGMSLAR